MQVIMILNGSKAAHTFLVESEPAFREHWAGDWCKLLYDSCTCSSCNLQQWVTYLSWRVKKKKKNQGSHREISC